MSSKLKCLLLDDELPGLTYLKMLCEQIPEVEVVKAFNNPELFLKETEWLDFDCCIIDIEMPGMNGLQVARLLRGKPVVFTTAYSEYAADAFDLNAIDYVRKPVKKERLQEAIAKLQQAIGRKDAIPGHASFNTDKGKTVVRFDQIAYLKVSNIDSRDKVALLHDGSSFTLKNISFGTLQKMLPEKEFARINKQEIIALSIVQSYTFNEVTSLLSSTEGAPLKFNLSEVYRRNFVKNIAL